MNSGVDPMKSDVFFHFIQTRTYETQGFIVHEVANKFNILSLGLEDLIDLLQEDGASQEEIKGEISAVETRSKSFGIVIEELRSFGKKGMNEIRSFDEIYHIVAKIKGDKLKDKEIVIGPKLKELKMNFYPGLLLLWGLTTIFLKQGIQSLEFLRTQKNTFTIKDLDVFLKIYDEDFASLFRKEVEILSQSLGL